jgi:hypothetical protein
MYACIPEIGGGFFEVVCRLEDRPHTFHDPPPILALHALTLVGTL